MACSVALAAWATLGWLADFLAATAGDVALAADLGAGFTAGLVVELFAALRSWWPPNCWCGRSSPPWCVAARALARAGLAAPVALADRIVLAELLAGAAFFTAVTSTSFQGVVDPGASRCERSERSSLTCGERATIPCLPPCGNPGGMAPPEGVTIQGERLRPG